MSVRLIHPFAAGGLYFPLERVFCDTLNKMTSDIISSHSPPSNSTSQSSAASWPIRLLSGTAAGSVNALLLNPLALVKYVSWGKSDRDRSLLKCLKTLWQAGGLRVLYMRGLSATVLRDALWGAVFSLRGPVQRHIQPSAEASSTTLNVAIKIFVAATATILSSPFNYIVSERYAKMSLMLLHSSLLTLLCFQRNVQYATPEAGSSMWQVLKALQAEVQAIPDRRARWKFVQGRLRLGWGTGRVAVGMTCGDYLFHLFNQVFVTE